MDITLEKSLEERLKAHPRVLADLPRILQEQLDLEDWRSRRYSEKEREAIQDVLKEVAKEAPVSRKESFRRLRGALSDSN